MKMKILIAPDSFKGSLFAAEAAASIAQGLQHASVKFDLIQLPMADGGEGSTEALCRALNGEKIELEADDPLGRPVQTFYGLVHEGKTAIVEVAQASGLTHLSSEKRNPLEASSAGTGQLIQHALDNRVENIWVCLGGSATVDGGLGMACALGLKAYDRAGNEVSPNGQGLIDVAEIDSSSLDPRLKQVKFKALYDVDNVLTGPQGARLYMPQKGATSEIMDALDAALEKWAELLNHRFGKDVAQLPGAGAAGGLGAGTAAILGAELASGIDFILDAVDFDHHLKNAQLVISGEGRVDAQTAYGKVVGGIARRTQLANLPLMVLCGAKEKSLDALYEAGVTAVYSITPGPVDEAEAFEKTPEWLESTAFNLGRMLDSMI